MLVFSILLYNYSVDLNNIEDPATEYLNQILIDWSTVPFVDVMVTNEWTCPDGQSEVFTRPWYGI